VARRKRIDPRKAAASAGGDPGWYRSIPVVDTRVTCAKCGTPSTLIGAGGECLRCRIEKRKAAREATPTA